MICFVAGSSATDQTSCGSTTLLNIRRGTETPRGCLITSCVKRVRWGRWAGLAMLPVALWRQGIENTGELATAGGTGLRVDPLQPMLHRPHREPEFGGDAPVRSALGRQRRGPPFGEREPHAFVDRTQRRGRRAFAHGEVPDRQLGRGVACTR